jgi:(2Fe-2S) ferredoxin
VPYPGAVSFGQMGKKKKLRKHLEKRGADDSPTLVICVGKDCCARSKSRALVEDTRAYVAESHANVHLRVVGCLHVCKKGPIAATYPKIEFKKRVDLAKAKKLVDQLDRRARADRNAS